MTTIRRDNVFETNSSSSHSVAIAYGVPVWDTIPTNEYGDVVIRSKEFGWQIEKVNDAETKAAYAFQSLTDDASQDMIKEVIQEVTECKNVIFFNPADEYSNASGYIDHDSVGRLKTGLDKFLAENRGVKKDFLKNFIFNSNSILALGNDNSAMPLNHGDPINQEYSHAVSFSGELYGEKVQFNNYAKLINWDEGFVSSEENEWKNDFNKILGYLLDEVKETKYYPSSIRNYDEVNRGNGISIDWDWIVPKIDKKKSKKEKHIRLSKYEEKGKFADGNKLFIFEVEYVYGKGSTNIYTDIGHLIMNITPI